MRRRHSACRVDRGFGRGAERNDVAIAATVSDAGAGAGAIPAPPSVDLPILQTAAFEGRTDVVLGNPAASICIDLHGDGSDTTEIWRNAFAEIAAHDSACLRVFGEHRISGELTLPDIPQLDIVGFGAVVRKIEAGDGVPAVLWLPRAW